MTFSTPQAAAAFQRVFAPVDPALLPPPLAHLLELPASEWNTRAVIAFHHWAHSGEGARALSQLEVDLSLLPARVPSRRITTREESPTQVVLFNDTPDPQIDLLLAGVAEHPAGTTKAAFTPEKHHLTALRLLVTSHGYAVDDAATELLRRVAANEKTGSPQTSPSLSSLASHPVANAPTITLSAVEGFYECRHMNEPRFTDVFRTMSNARWDAESQSYQIPVTEHSRLTRLAKAHKISMPRKPYEPFPFDGTLDGLRGFPIEDLAAIPKSRAASFHNMGIHTIYDLLHTVPRRYLDRSEIVPVRQLVEGTESCVIGTVAAVKSDARRRMARITVRDASGSIQAVFFNAAWQAKRFTVGQQVIMFGKPEKYRPTNSWSMVNPLLDPFEDTTIPVIPIYPQSGKNSVSTWDIRRAAAEALERIPNIIDPIPPHALENIPMELLSRWEALQQMHFPSNIQAARDARNRVAFDELFRMQTALLLSKNADSADMGVAMPLTGRLTSSFTESLPYPLTGAQERAIEAIRTDLQRDHPMHRLLQGDVGAGKAQPMYSRVLTPRGFVSMADIEVGHYITNPDGGSSLVTGVFPQGLRQIWRVEFSDGTSVDCDGEHLWQVSAEEDEPERAAPPVFSHTLTTREIAAGLARNTVYSVPLTSAVEFDIYRRYPADPPDLSVHYGLEQRRYSELREGLVDSVEERRILLARYCMSIKHYKSLSRPTLLTWPSRQSAEEVAWLCRSLGGVAHIQQLGDTDVDTLLHLPLAEDLNPGKRIVRITQTPHETPMRCISVDHPNQLYITDGFTVTHNTTVAVWSLLAAVEAGHQAALMAPTEILAKQLYVEAVARTESLHAPNGDPLRVEFFSNKLRGKKKTAALEDLANGSIHIAVGTHALISDDIQFANLGLAVVDEQHRFGVEQRARLRGKRADGAKPDMLIMTATPIPRTSAMTVFGDLDLTILDELPPGRTPVVTEWFDMEPDLVEPTIEPWETIRQQIGEGRQAFIVCPLVEESEKLQAASAVETFEQLAGGALNGLRLGLVHGQQKAEERDATMLDFRDGELDALIATTVIEVGVNVPNATVMVVLDSIRFGISQLHQLRGRVGRGAHESYCYLIGRGKSGDSRERMMALVESTDGFWLSERDAEIRSVGTIFGSRQSGESDLKVADLRADKDLLYEAREAVNTLLAEDPHLARYPGLRNEVFAALTPEAREWLSRN